MFGFVVPCVQMLVFRLHRYVVLLDFAKVCFVFAYSKVRWIICFSGCTAGLDFPRIGMGIGFWHTVKLGGSFGFPVAQ